MRREAATLAQGRGEGTGWFASPNEIFDRDDLNTHEKLVLLFLCRSVGADGRAWPSYARIAKACGISRRSAIETVRSLADKQLVSATPRRDDAGDAATNLYRLQFGSRSGATGAPGSAQAAPPSAGDAPGVVQDVHRGGAPPAPEGHSFKVTHPKDNTPPPPSPVGEGGGESEASPEPEPNRQRTPSDYTPEFERFWETYPRRTEKKRAFRAWKATLKRHTTENPITPDMLHLAAGHYADDCTARGRAEDYIKHGSTFLGPDEPWRDWLQPRGSPNGDGSAVPHWLNSKYREEDDLAPT